jgi:hypothetical protein
MVDGEALQCLAKLVLETTVRLLAHPPVELPAVRGGVGGVGLSDLDES